MAGEEGRGRLEPGGAGRPTASLRGRLHAVGRGRSASSPHGEDQGHVGVIGRELVRQGAGTVLRGEHLCDGAGDHLGPDGLHQGDHRSEQCHWQVGDPHEQGVQRARGRDRRRFRRVSVGELIWLVTRSRPDLAYVVSRMSSFVSKAPRWVQRTATQTLRYLNATKTEGILLDKDMGEDTDGRKSSGLLHLDASGRPVGRLPHGKRAGHTDAGRHRRRAAG